MHLMQRPISQLKQLPSSDLEVLRTQDQMSWFCHTAWSGESPLWAWACILYICAREELDGWPLRFSAYSGILCLPWGIRVKHWVNYYYYCITSYPKTYQHQQHLLSHSFCEFPKLRLNLNGGLRLKVPHNLQSTSWLELQSPQCSVGGRSASELTPVTVSRIRFLQGCWTDGLRSCWLLARDSHPSTPGLLHRVTQQGCWMFFFPPQWEKDRVGRQRERERKRERMCPK